MFYRLKKHLSHDYDQNVVEQFKPVYKLLSLTGLFPYSIRFPKGKYDCKITRRSWLPHFLCGIMMFAYVCSYCVFCFMNVSITPEGILLEINYIIEILVVLICSISSYFCAYWYRKVYVRVLRRIAFVWTDLSNAPNHDVKPILMYLRKLFKVPFIFWLLFALPVETLLWMIGVVSFWEHWFLVFPEAVPSLVVIFFSATVLMVVGLLKNIKHRCQSLVAMKYQNSSVHVMKTKQNLKEDYFILLNNLELAYVNALEVSQLAQLLHRIPIQTQKQNLCLLMQIQHFSTLISFHGADISIYGFFTLDASLLFNMTASMATYLIILVQFDT